MSGQSAAREKISKGAQWRSGKFGVYPIFSGSDCPIELRRFTPNVHAFLWLVMSGSGHRRIGLGFTCDYCQKKCTSQRDLDRHRNRCGNKRRRASSPDENDGDISSAGEPQSAGASGVGACGLEDMDESEVEDMDSGAGGFVGDNASPDDRGIDADETSNDGDGVRERNGNGSGGGGGAGGSSSSSSSSSRSSSSSSSGGGGGGGGGGGSSSSLVESSSEDQSSSDDQSTSDDQSSRSSNSSSRGRSSSGDGDGGNLPSSPVEKSVSGRSCDSAGGGDLPWLEDLVWTSAADEGKTSTVVDGDPEQLRCTPQGMASKWCPYPNLTFAILANYVRLASLTRAQQNLLFSCLRYTDEDGQGIIPADVPACADHFAREARLLTPLLPVTEREIDDKKGFTTSVVGFSPAALLQRRLESPGAAAGILDNLEGHQLTSAEREAEGVPDEHLTPVATKPAGGLRRGFLHGKVAAASALMGLESLLVGPSGRQEKIFVGDTVLVASADERPEEARPYRLAEVVWVEDLSRLVSRVSPFLTSAEARITGAGAPPDVVWEVVDGDGGEEIDISRIEGRCDVVPHVQGAGAGSSSSGRVFSAAGFIRRCGKEKYKKVWSPSGQRKVLPWRFEGLDGLFFDKRAARVYFNKAGLPVFSIPLVIFTDAFNFFQRGGSPYSINATHFTIGSTTRAFRRRLESWDLCSLGAPRARWEQELDGVFGTIGKMQNGCRARVCIDGKPVVVSKVSANLSV